MSENIKKLFSNGYFKIMREIIYVVSFVVVLTLAWANLTSSVKHNSENILINVSEIKALKEQASVCGTNITEIKTDVKWVKSYLEKGG